MMSQLISFDDDFKSLAKQVRAHRTTLEKCYSTKLDQPKSIKELVAEYTETDYYKNDYENRTYYLIDEKDITIKW